MQRPTATFHGINQTDKETKLASLRMAPLGPRSLVDPTAFARPEGHAYRKEEKSTDGAGIRIRMEPNSRDTMNSRIYEAMPYSSSRTISTGDFSRNSRPIAQDMNPIDSRRSVGNYKQSIEFFPTPDPIQTSLGFQPQTSNIKLPERLESNPYLQRLDAANEPRQIVRELRSAVTEDNREKYIDFSQRLADRSFSHHWIQPQEAQTQQMTNLQAYELLKPKIDDFSTDWHRPK
jgi:hypothetical protein